MRTDLQAREIPAHLAGLADPAARIVIVTADWSGVVASAPALRSPNALCFAVHQALVDAGLMSGGARFSQPRAAGDGAYVFTLWRGEARVSVQSLQRRCHLCFRLQSRHPDELASAHHVIHVISQLLGTRRDPDIAMRTSADTAVHSSDGDALPHAA